MRVQNDRGHRSYVLEADSLCMQVRGEGGVGVGAGVDGAIPWAAANCCSR
jgi:hypothetical protein